jgi:hypothetical protein
MMAVSISVASPTTANHTPTIVALSLTKDNLAVSVANSDHHPVL